ncbi:MAG: phosphodiester glycosidase family protein [Micrococcales bacterium]
MSTKRNRQRKPRSRARRIVRAIGFTVLAILGLNLVYFGVQTVIRANTAHEDLGMAAADVGRDIGYGPLMALSENFYYQVVNPAQVGGKPTDSAVFGKVVAAQSPAPSESAAVTPTASAIKANNPSWGPAAATVDQVPANVATPAKHPVANEGVWMPTKIKVNGRVAVYVARVRPDSQHTSFFDTLVWLDPKALAFQEVPGTLEPKGNYPHGTGRVPAKLKRFYVAGINGGYKTVNMHGGFIYKGTTAVPMRNDAATLLTYPDGSIDIRNWGVDAIKPGYISARQNLPMLVSNGVNQVKNNNDSQWGSLAWGTASGANFVWRSAIGVRADGSVVHLVGPSMSQRDLADLMVRAGVVRAMCLDMNNGWASSYFYGPYGSGVPVDPQITRPASRFLNSSTRDFIAVYAKSPADAVAKAKAKTKHKKNK